MIKKILKKEVIIAFIIGVLIASGITVYAYSYFASDIGYTKPGTETAISVEEALNELYSKSNKTAQQVGTMTTKGASYTFQHDGYITGNITGVGSTYAVIFFNETEEIAVSENGNLTRTVSIYVPSGTIVKTREYGTYNLTLYEFK